MNSQTVLVFLFLWVVLGNAEGDFCELKSSNLAPVKLKTDLLCDYDVKARPTLHHNNVTTVGVRMLIKSFTYDMQLNKISVNSWLALYWNDEYLKWKPSDYENIKTISLNMDEIWTPDLSVYNRNDQSGSPLALESVDCLVTFKGKVVCVSPSRHDGLCLPNLTRYPFDTQTCSIKYGSWLYPGEEMNLTLSKPSFFLADFSENPEWELINVTGYRDAGNYSCCVGTYPSLIYQFTMRRHSAVFQATIVAPAIVLVLLTMTSLFMDVNESDRLYTSCLNLICHILYIHHVYWQIPATGSKPPLIIIFFRDSTLLCALLIILTIVFRSIAKIHVKPPYLISCLVRQCVAIGIGKVLMVENDNDKKRTPEQGEEVTKEENTAHIDWFLFVVLLDRILAVIYFITYFGMFIALVP